MRHPTYSHSSKHYLSELMETVALLEAWAAWSRAHPIRPRSCGSAERFYMAPSDLDVEPISWINYCLNDVLKVEKAWQGLPEKNKQFLRLFYIKGRPRHKICRHLALPNREEDWQALHHSSVLMIRNRIKFNDKK